LYLGNKEFYNLVLNLDPLNSQKTEDSSSQEKSRWISGKYRKRKI